MASKSPIIEESHDYSREESSPGADTIAHIRGKMQKREHNLSVDKPDSTSNAAIDPIWPGIKDQTIVLDAPPMSKRPDALLPDILVGTDLPIVPTRSRTFGAWTYDYSHISAETWNSSYDRLGRNIKKLYRSGLIRYASWGEPTVQSLVRE